MRRRLRARLAALACLAGVCGAGTALAVATAPVAPASAAASASSCPAGGEGGPFLRICSKEVFKNTPIGIGASALLTLPCTKRDLVERTLYVKGIKGLTVDEGYAYFALYQPGTSSDEVEAGYFHNANLKGDQYTLYVRHKGFWNSVRPVACGTQVGLQVIVAYSTTGDIDVQVQGNPVHAPVQYCYTFHLKPKQTPMEPNEISSAKNSQAKYPAGKGSIGPLTTPPWQRGCTACSIAIVTAVAQNGPGGNVPKLPLKDGASFGPVLWRGARLYDGPLILLWSPTYTAQSLVWKAGITSVDKTGVQPNYTVSWVSVPCVQSASGNDRWKCGKGAVHL